MKQISQINRENISFEKYNTNNIYDKYTTVYNTLYTDEKNKKNTSIEWYYNYSINKILSWNIYTIGGLAFQSQTVPLSIAYYYLQHRQKKYLEYLRKEINKLCMYSLECKRARIIRLIVELNSTNFDSTTLLDFHYVFTNIISINRIRNNMFTLHEYTYSMETFYADCIYPGMMEYQFRLMDICGKGSLNFFEYVVIFCKYIIYMYIYYNMHTQLYRIHAMVALWK